MTTRGVFRLSSYRSQELQGDGVPMDDVWYLDKLQQKGYVIGGSNAPGASTSNYQSLSYGTDTRGNIANLPVGKSGLFGTASPSAGYTYGGYTLPYGPTFYSSSNKLVFSTETHTELPGTRFTDAGNGYARGGSCGSQTHGYICGGNGPSEPGGYSRLDKMTYATETIERIPGSNMPSPGQEYNSSASADGNTAGYWVGGANGSGSHVRKLNFSNDSWGSLPNLPGANPLNRMQKAGQASSDTGTYLVGGSNPYNRSVQKITFATGNNAIVANSTVPTPAGRIRLTGTGNASSGYFCGGTETSIVEKMNFSTNSISRIPAMDLAQGVQDLGSMSAVADNKVAPAPKKWIDNSVPGGDAIEFDGSDDYVYQTVTSPYAVRNWWDQAFTVEYWINADSFGSSSNTGSNVVGVCKHTSTGETWSFGPRNTGEVLWYWWNGSIQRFYSGTTLSANRWYHLAFVHDAGSMKIFVDGILVNSDTVSGTPSGSSDTFAIGRITQNPTYFNGRISNLRITHAAVYSNNFTVPTEPLTEIAGTVLLCCNQGSATASTITPDPFSKGGDPIGVVDADLKFNLVPTATPTSSQALDPSITVPDVGYNMKGNTPGGLTSRISKIAFATDTKSNPGNMPTTGEHSTDFSSLTAAYSNTGKQGGTNYTSGAQKVTYSTDSASSVPGGQSLTYQRQTAKCATMTHGYIAGGLTPSPTSSNFNKMTFSNETYSLLSAKVTYAPSGVYHIAAAFNSSTTGYWGGGSISVSSATKLNFSTDTSSANPGNLPIPLTSSASLGNGEVAGYTVSGGAPSIPGNNYSATTKMLYSTETFSIVPGANWNPIRYGMTSFSSFNAGYSGMGYESNDPFSKMPWNTETWSTIPGNFPSGSSNTRDTGGGTSAKSNSGGKPTLPVVL